MKKEQIVEKLNETHYEILRTVVELDKGNPDYVIGLVIFLVIVIVGLFLSLKWAVS